jgi:transposase
MANNLKEMKLIREILELTHSKLSQRAIANRLGVSRKTVKEYQKLLEQSDIPIDTVLSMNEADFSVFIKAYKPQSTQLQEERYNTLASQFEHITKDLKRVGVTKYLLWIEYKANNADGYCYQQFCYHYNKHLMRNNASLRQIHKMGDCLMVDYAGDKLHYIDRTTGELIKCDVLVTCMGYSGYTYVHASHTQQQSDFIEGINNALAYFGGAPHQMLSDNLSTVVKKADRYCPKFTDLITDLSIHYKMDLSATRVAKPKDKGKVEGAVLNTYRKIYAVLRNKNFYSLQELNGAIKQELIALNAKAFQGKNYSRKDLFEEEKSMLNQLPSSPFEIKKTKQVKAQKNYHVELEHQYFSIPYMYIGEYVQAYYTSTIVEIYHKDKKIATHIRDRKKYHYHTTAAHMPSNHIAHLQSKGYDKQYFINQAKQFGNHTEAFIEKLFTTKIYIEQTFNSCIGFFRYAGQYSPLRVEAACFRALQLPTVHYKTVEDILKKGLDKEVAPPIQNPIQGLYHENIRTK